MVFLWKMGMFTLQLLIKVLVTRWFFGFWSMLEMSSKSWPEKVQEEFCQTWTQSTFRKSWFLSFAVWSLHWRVSLMVVVIGEMKLPILFKWICLHHQVVWMDKLKVLVQQKLHYWGNLTSQIRRKWRIMWLPWEMLSWRSIENLQIEEQGLIQAIWKV